MVAVIWLVVKKGSKASFSFPFGSKFGAQIIGQPYQILAQRFKHMFNNIYKGLTCNLYPCIWLAAKKGGKAGFCLTSGLGFFWGLCDDVSGGGGGGSLYGGSGGC